MQFLYKIRSPRPDCSPALDGVKPREDGSAAGFCLHMTLQLSGANANAHTLKQKGMQHCGKWNETGVARLKRRIPVACGNNCGINNAKSTQFTDLNEGQIIGLYTGTGSRCNRPGEMRIWSPVLPLIATGLS